MDFRPFLMCVQQHWTEKERLASPCRFQLICLVHRKTNENGKSNTRVRPVASVLCISSCLKLKGTLKSWQFYAAHTSAALPL